MFVEVTQCHTLLSECFFFSFKFIFFFKLSWSYTTLKACLQPWLSPHHLDVRLWGGMWSLRCLADLCRYLTASLQEADIWWMSFWKMIINTVFLLYRRFWPLLRYNCSLKAKSINPCCCRGLTFVPHIQGHVHMDSFSRNLLHQCLQGLRGAFLGGCSRHFTWLGHEGARH